MNTLYFIETQTAKLGRWFLECDRDSNSRDAALSSIRNGEAIKVLEISEDEGTCRDVTDDLRAECGFPDDYRTTMTGEDAAAWQADRRRAEAMAE
jgi:hypothetical protein